MLRVSRSLLMWAMMFRRWVVDRQLAAHVLDCRRRCTRDLVNCDEGQFCKIGKALFNESFDLTFCISENAEHERLNVSCKLTAR